jgi:hypothetical protein
LTSEITKAQLGRKRREEERRWKESKTNTKRTETDTRRKFFSFKSSFIFLFKLFFNL